MFDCQVLDAEAVADEDADEYVEAEDEEEDEEEEDVDHEREMEYEGDEVCLSSVVDILNRAGHKYHHCLSSLITLIAFSSKLHVSSPAQGKSGPMLLQHMTSEA